MKDYAVFALLCFCWGSTFLAAKLALEVVPPVFLAGVRFVLASSILFFWLIIAKQKVTARAALKILLSSLFTITFAFGLLFWGIQHLPSGLSGVISFAGVAVSLPLLSVVVKQEVFSVKRFSGVLLGHVGLILLMVSRVNTQGLELMAITAIVASACCYAYGSSLTKSLAKHVSTFALSAWQMGLGGLMLVFVSAVFEKNFFAHVLAISEVYLSFAYLAFVGSLLGFTSYTYLLRCWPASRVSSYTFVCPIIALVLGYVVLGERVSGLELTASVVMVFGAGLALKV